MLRLLLLLPTFALFRRDQRFIQLCTHASTNTNNQCTTFKVNPSPQVSVGYVSHRCDYRTDAVFLLCLSHPPLLLCALPCRYTISHAGVYAFDRNGQRWARKEQVTTDGSKKVSLKSMPHASASVYMYHKQLLLLVQSISRRLS